MSNKNKGRDTESLAEGSIKTTVETGDSSSHTGSSDAEAAHLKADADAARTQGEGVSRTHLGNADTPPLVQGNAPSPGIVASGIPSAQTAAAGDTAKTAGDANAGKGPLGEAPSNVTPGAAGDSNTPGFPGTLPDAARGDSPQSFVDQPTGGAGSVLNFTPNADALPGDVRAKATPTSAKAPRPPSPGFVWCVVLHGTFMQGGTAKAQGSTVEISEQEWESVKLTGALKKLDG
jgi:hypothetical protein